MEEEDSDNNGNVVDTEDEPSTHNYYDGSSEEFERPRYEYYDGEDDD